MARIIDSKEKNLVGGIIRSYRLKQKMSQQLLSDKLELLGVYICRGSVSRIEDGTRTVTDVELYALAQTLNIPWDELSPQKNFNK